MNDSPAPRKPSFTWLASGCSSLAWRQPGKAFQTLNVDHWRFKITPGDAPCNVSRTGGGYGCCDGNGVAERVKSE
jgi:hypothetical protein